MGGGGKPGVNLGLMKCDVKTAFDDQVEVHFSGEHSSSVFVLSKEESNYFVVDESYNFSATQPG